MKKKPEIILQFAGKEFTTEDLMKKATEAYTNENGKEPIQDMKLYVKPEESKAYYVVNQDTTGSLAI